MDLRLFLAFFPKVHPPFWLAMELLEEYALAKEDSKMGYHSAPWNIILHPQIRRWLFNLIWVRLFHRFVLKSLRHIHMSVMHISTMIVWAEGESESLSLYLSLAGILCPVMLVLLPLMNYLGMSIMRDVQQLPDQLQNFRLQDAQCFCCSHHHRHPETGQELICDRELVYQTLTDLYSPSRRLGGGFKHFAIFPNFYPENRRKSIQFALHIAHILQMCGSTLRGERMVTTPWRSLIVVSGTGLVQRFCEEWVFVFAFPSNMFLAWFLADLWGSFRNWPKLLSIDIHFLKENLALANANKVLFLVMVSNLASLPRVVKGLVEGSGHLISWSHRAIWSSLVFLQWSQKCLVMIFFLEISVRLWTLLKFRQRKVAWAIVLSPIQFGAVGCFWICLELPYIEESWVPFVVFLVALTLCVLLHLW